MTIDIPLGERRVAEIMTADLLTIAAGESVLMAWELICRADVHHLPVVDDQGAFLGVVDAQTLTAAWDSAGSYKARKPVTTLLSSAAPAWVRSTDSVRVAARVMLDAGTDHVAVVDAHAALVGLLTANDLIGALAGAAPEKAPQRSGMPSLYRIEPVLPRPAARTRVPVTNGRSKPARPRPSVKPAGRRPVERNGGAFTPGSCDSADPK
ncbi:HPP family protein [Actinomadura sp. 21ATH]|uniref:CBS domain-containing protein n=1 Tax=Actinomadura sp. 21ATH TaxID=1735444 RepID=UPI0035C010D8